MSNPKDPKALNPKPVNCKPGTLNPKLKLKTKLRAHMGVSKNRCTFFWNADNKDPTI